MCDGNCEGCYNKQDHSKSNRFHKLNEALLNSFGGSEYLIPIGKPETLVVQNPSNSKTLDDLMQDFFKNKSVFIPANANAYVVSDFHGGTQHIRIIDGEDKPFSVYAVQFYRFAEFVD